MAAKVGQYHFRRHRTNWGIFQYDFVCDKSISSRFIKDCFTFEEAVKETYRLNGWGEPKRIYKSF